MFVNHFFEKVPLTRQTASGYNRQAIFSESRDRYEPSFAGAPLAFDAVSAYTASGPPFPEGKAWAGNTFSDLPLRGRWQPQSEATG